MLKNLRIAWKLGVGFGVVLLLTVVSAYVSWRSQNTLIERADKAAGVDHIYNEVTQGRVDVLYYMQFRDESKIAVFQKRMEELEAHVAKLKKSFANPANKERMDNVSQAAAAYKQFFTEYVDLEGKRGEVIATVVEAATALQTVADELALALEKSIELSAEFGGASVNITSVNLMREITRDFLFSRIDMLYYLWRGESKRVDDCKANLDKVIASAQELAKLVDTEADRQRTAKIIESAQVYKSRAEDFRTVAEAQTARAQEMAAQASKVAEIAVEALAFQDKAMDDQAKLSNQLILGFATASFAIGLAFAMLITRIIQRGVNQARATAEAIAIGDMEQEIVVDSKDEIGLLLSAMQRLVKAEHEVSALAEQLSEGDLRATVAERSKHDRLMQSLGQMVRKLTEVVGDVQASAGYVAAGSEELTSSSESLSQGASEQAASIEEVSASMEQMSSSIAQNADNARQTESIALKAAEDAKESGRAVAQTVQAMKDIAEKISIIEEIARQTDLLALNAAIEAARAGDHGKGFAVVASEVRKLAERSQVAAAQINELSSSSLDVAEKAGGLLDKLVPDIKRTSELVQEIAASSNEQAQGASQVNNALQQLDQVTQSNASASEELASTSEELSAQASQLQGAISFFVTASSTPAKSTARKAPPKPRRAAPAAREPKAIPKAGLALDLGGDEADDDHFERY